MCVCLCVALSLASIPLSILTMAPATESLAELNALHMLFRRASRIDPTADQRTLIIVACVYLVVIILLWNLPYIKMIIYPFKLLTVGFHEFGHAAMGLATCARVESIHLDPNEGGVTRMRGGIPALTLPAGYLGSSLIGAAMIATAFDIQASKVMTIVIGVFFLFTLWWARRDWLAWVLLLCMAGLIVGFWFIADGVALQYLVLFIVSASVLDVLQLFCLPCVCVCVSFSPSLRASCHVFTQFGISAMI